MSWPLLQLGDVWMEFPNGTVALRGAHLGVERGSIHGLVGANGAGKSTLFKIVAGALQPTAGEIRWKGRSVRWAGPAAPRAAGISTIYQHLPLVPTTSVLENVFLGERGWLVDRGRQLAAYEALLDRVGYDLDPDLVTGELSIGQRQMVAIMHALAGGAELVLMDEPTASLAQGERELLFDAVRRLGRGGQATFVYCSHFLDEVLKLTGSVTVLRDGEVVLEGPTAGLTEDALVEATVGRRLLQVEGHRQSPMGRGPALLEVEDLTSPGRVHGVSFEVRAGEIVGLAGLLGSGRSEILHAVFGSDRQASGRVRLHGRELRRGPGEAVRAGLALVPEDRTRQGLIADWEIWRNTSLPDLPRLSWGGWLPANDREVDRARRAMADLRVVAPGPQTPVSALSGGNAQKVVFAKWRYGSADVFLLDEPTVGVDVGTKADILALIRAFADEGKAVVLVSSEFEELLGVAHRVLVVRHGLLAAERPVQETDEEELMALASGLQAV